VVNGRPAIQRGEILIPTDTLIPRISQRCCWWSFAAPEVPDCNETS